MNPPTTHSRARRVGVAAAALAVAWMLAGCSAVDEGFDTSSQADLARPAVDEGHFGEQEAIAEDSAGIQDEATSPLAPDTRSVIVTGGLYVTVEDPVTAAEKATGIVKDAGGRVDARNETAPNEYDGGSAWLTLRIPSPDLEAVVDDLGELGTVDQYTTNSYDVTTEVTDLEAQISTLRASTGRIEALLLEAEDIEDIITLESELDQRQARLESLEARQRGLEDQVSMSTIELTLTTEPVVIVDDSPTSFWDGLVAGWNGLVSFLSGALVVLGVMLPWLALIALIAAVLILAVRAALARRRAKSAQTAPQAPLTPPAPPAQATASEASTDN